MIDPVQAILIAVVVTLAIVMIVLGIQVYMILREVKQTLTRVNSMLDQAEAFTENFATPMALLSGILASTKSLAPILKLFNRK